MKRAFAAVAIATAVGLVSACGAAPADASKKDFCSSTKAFQKTSKWNDVQKANDKLKSTGTPKGISKDARAGFTVLTDTIGEAKSEKALTGSQKKLSKAEQKNVMAFLTYASKTCGL